MMNIISSVLRLTPLYSTSTTAQTLGVRQPNAIIDTPSSQVSLGLGEQAGSTATYSSKGTLSSPGTRYLWEHDSLDKLTLKMFSSVTTTDIGARFKGLGAALIEQLSASGGQRISQSALLASDTATPTAMLAQQRASLREHASNSVTLNLTAASGATISIGLYSSEQGLAVDASVESGELSTDELKSLAVLADGFQQAIDGLNQQPPSLQLTGLLKVDQPLFSDLRLSAKLDLASGGQQALDLHLDDATRSLSLQGPSGEVKMNLDNKGGALLGGRAQREAALGSYLSQFEAAQKRGKGDESLAALFKDALRQLNAVDDQGAPSTRHGSVLNTLSPALLSGLADFDASISQTVEHNNPLRPEEVERFDYTLSQTTRIRGADAGLSRQLQQEQASSLKAAWHTSLTPGVELQLSRDTQSQNYRYHEINDQASSTTRLSIISGALAEATTSRQASRSERVRDYQQSVLTSDITDAQEQQRSGDLKQLLETLRAADNHARLTLGASTLDQQLAGNSHLWLLQGDPRQL